MLEQLLMNMKVDWVAVAVQTLHQLLAGQKIGFTVEDIDNLLSKYAEKALNFPFTLKEKRSGNCLSDAVFHLGKKGRNNFSNHSITFLHVCLLSPSSPECVLKVFTFVVNGCFQAPTASEVSQNFLCCSLLRFLFLYNTGQFCFTPV